jgi:hypothetical protein
MARKLRWQGHVRAWTFVIGAMTVASCTVHNDRYGSGDLGAVDLRSSGDLRDGSAADLRDGSVADLRDGSVADLRDGSFTDLRGTSADLRDGATPTFVVTPSGDGNETIAPATAQATLLGATQTFAVTAKSCFALSTNVGGTCAPGTWNGNQYTTGAIAGDCTVVFAASAATSIAGKVTFSDGALAKNATVTARSGSVSLSTTTDTNGLYSLSTGSCTPYDISVQFNLNNVVSGNRTLLTAQSYTGPTHLDLVIPLVTLQGNIVDRSAQKVAAVKLSGVAFSQGGGGFDTFSTTSDSNGHFSVEILPNSYFSLQLVPPDGSAYVTTSIPDQAFTQDTVKDFVIANAVTISGTAKFSDGTLIVGGTVTAQSNAVRLTAQTNGSGAYSLSVASGTTYDIGVSFNAGNGTQGNRTVLNAVSYSASTTVDLTVPLITLQGNIVDGSAQPVASVKLAGAAFSQGGGGFDTFSTTSDGNGHFSVKIVPNSYFSLQLTPPNGSTYVTTAIANQAFSTDTTTNFVIAQGVLISGTALFSDSTPVANATVTAQSNSVGLTAQTDGAGAYSLRVGAGTTYDVGVSFSLPNGTQGNRTVLNGVSYGAPTTVNLNVPLITLQGTIVDASAQPVAAVKLGGAAFSQGGGGFDTFSTVSDGTGHFSVKILPNSYFSLQLTPPDGSGYIATAIPDQAFTQDTTKSFVVNQ